MISRWETTDVRVAHVMDVVGSDPGTTIEPLANEINLSPSRLQHLFLEETGVSLGTYISETRLRLAARLLRTTYKQVKEISYDVGYQHPSSFVRAFKARYAIVPTQYRAAETLGYSSTV